MRYWMFLLVCLVGCGNYDKYPGTIIGHGTEKEVVHYTQRYGPDVWKIEEHEYTEVKLEDGRVIRLPCIVGEVDERVVVTAPVPDEKTEKTDWRQ